MDSSAVLVFKNMLNDLIMACAFVSDDAFNVDIIER